MTNSEKLSWVLTGLVIILGVVVMGTAFTLHEIKPLNKGLKLLESKVYVWAPVVSPKVILDSPVHDSEPITWVIYLDDENAVDPNIIIDDTGVTDWQTKGD